MTTYRSPGVYIEELPGPQVISQVSTSNTAFVGRTARGSGENAVLITSWDAYQAAFGGFAWGAQLPFAIYAFFAQGGSIAYVVPIEGDGEITASTEVGTMKMSAASPGSWGNDLCIQVTNISAETPPSATQTPIFGINILAKVPEADAALTLNQQLIARYAQNNSIAPQSTDDVEYYLLESFPGLSAKDLAKGSGAGEQAPIERRINGNSVFVRVEVSKGNPATRPSNIVVPQKFKGSTTDTPPDFSSGLGALDTVDDISLLVVPDVAMIEDLNQQREMAESVVNYCENRPHRDLFAILDSPFGLDVQTVEAYKTGAPIAGGEQGQSLHSSYGAIYYPWVEMLDPVSSKNVIMPPSGAMAGTYAAADSQVGPWQSPAGTSFGALNVVTGVEHIVTSIDQEVLNPNGINAIRPFVDYGILSYGARTLTTDPSLLYIAVRRTLIDIEMSLYRGLQWVVFEPTTPRLWGSVARDVTQFLTEMWQAGALVGARASEAFWVKCDESNNPPDLQRQGQMIVEIGVAPSYPAEFIVIRIQQTTVGTS